MEDAVAKLLGVDLLDARQLAALWHRRQLELGGFALGDQRSVQGLRIGRGDDAVDHGLPDHADLAVQLGDDGLQRGAVLRDGVGRVGEVDDRAVDQAQHVLLREHLAGDVLQQAGVHDVHADGQPEAVLLVLLPRRADVVVIVGLPRASTDGHANPAAAGSAPEPRREQAVLTEADRVVAVAALGLGALPELADGGDTGEVVVGHGRGMGVPRHDLAVVHDVAGVHGAGEHLLDVLPPPRSAVALAGEVGAPRRIDPFARQLLREALSAVAAIKVFGEQALHRLEVGAGVVGDDEATALHRVAEGRMSVLPLALFGLAAHPALDVARQLLGVPLGQPREDRPDQLAERLVASVGLGEGDHVDIRLVEGRERAQAVHHVPGHAGERPHIESVDPLQRDGALRLRVALGLRPAQQRLVRGPLLRGAPADPLIDEPQVVGNGHAVRGGATRDFLALLLDALVLARVRAAKVGGADDGHGGLRRGWIKLP